MLRTAVVGRSRRPRRLRRPMSGAKTSGARSRAPGRRGSARRGGPSPAWSSRGGSRTARAAGRGGEPAGQPHQGVGDGRVAAGVGGRVGVSAERGQGVGPEAGAGVLGGHPLETAACGSSASSRRCTGWHSSPWPRCRPRGACGRRRRRRAATAGGPAGRAACRAARAGSCSRSPWRSRRGPRWPRSASSGRGRSRAGSAAWQASSAVVRRVSRLSRSASALRAAIAAGSSPAASASWAVRIAAGSSASGCPLRSSIAFFSSSTLPVRTAQAASIEPALRVRGRARGLGGGAYRKTSAGRPGGRTAIAQDLVDARRRRVVLLPEPLELDQVGDHPRRDGVGRALVDPPLGQPHRRAPRRWRWSARPAGRRRRLAHGAEGQLGQVALGGQLGDLHRLLEAVEGQDRQVGGRPRAWGGPWAWRPGAWASW